MYCAQLFCLHRHSRENAGAKIPENTFLRIKNYIFHIEIDYRMLPPEYKIKAFVLHLQGSTKILHYIVTYGKNSFAVQFNDVMMIQYNEITKFYFMFSKDYIAHSIYRFQRHTKEFG